ncbi:MAG: beta-ketoacyl-ACP reductase [Candidatus Meridianibacter frigidus]|nr:MAG: beta-ketoacyl-ACP reductase [Candidatus Eremiobacteraeota bacterium]
MNFEGRVAFVTGASRGIGRAIAADLAKYGADLVLVGRDAEALQATASVLKDQRSNTKAYIVLADAAEPAAVQGAVDEALAEFGRIDFAVANAGQSADSLLMRLKPEALDHLLSVNLKSAFFMCSSVARPMMKARSGSIVLVSSIVGIMGNAGQSAYAASKAGLLGLAKSLAKELGSRNIRVNAVAPGLIQTAMTEKMPEAAREYLLNASALGRAGTPQEVSGVVTFLCSDAAAYVTGQTLVVDGGVLM